MIFGWGNPSARHVMLIFWFSRTATDDGVLSISKIFGGTIYAMDKQLMIVETYLRVCLSVSVYIQVCSGLSWSRQGSFKNVPFFSLSVRLDSCVCACVCVGMDECREVTGLDRCIMDADWEAETWVRHVFELILIVVAVWMEYSYL